MPSDRETIAESCADRNHSLLKPESRWSRIRAAATANAIQNVLAVMVTRGGLGIFRLAVLLIIAEREGPRGFGPLAFAAALVEVLRIVVDFGSENYFLPRIARVAGTASEANELSRMLAFRTFSSSAGTVTYLCVIGLGLAGTQANPDLLIISLLIPTGALLGTCMTYFQAHVMMIQAARIVAPTMGCALLAGAFAWQKSTEALLLILVTMEVVASVSLLTAVCLRTGVTFRSVIAKFQFKSLMATAVECWPLASTAFMVTAYARVDVLMIQLLLGSAAVGLFSVAYRLTDPLRFVASAVDSTVYGILSNHERRNRLLAPRMQRRLWLRLITYAATFGGLSCISGFAVLHFLMPQFEQARVAVLLLGVTVGFRCFVGVLTIAQYSLGHVRVTQRLALINLIILLVLIVPCTKLMGITGAALALVLVEVCNCIAQVRHSRILLRSLQ